MAINQGRVVIEISGGIIQNITADKHIQVIIKDYDNDPNDDSKGEKAVVNVQPDMVEEVFNRYRFNTET